MARTIIRCAPQSLPMVRKSPPGTEIVVNFYYPAGIVTAHHDDWPDWQPYGESQPGDVTLADYDTAIAEGRVPAYLTLEDHIPTPPPFEIDLGDHEDAEDDFSFVLHSPHV